MISETERPEVTVLIWEVKDDLSTISWEVRGFDRLLHAIHPEQHVLSEVNGNPTWRNEVGHYDCSSSRAVHVGPFDLRCRAPTRPEHNADGKWYKKIAIILKRKHVSLRPSKCQGATWISEPRTIRGNCTALKIGGTHYQSINLLIRPFFHFYLFVHSSADLDNVRKVNIIVPATLPLWRINRDINWLVQPRGDHAPSRRAVQPGDFDSARLIVCPVDIPSDQIKGQAYWRRNIGFCDDFHRRAVQKRSGDSAQGIIGPVNPFFFGIVGQPYRLGYVL